jgi:hypothetical protein
MTKFIVYVPENGTIEYVTTFQDEQDFIMEFLIPNDIDPDDCDRLVIESSAVEITTMLRYTG